MKHQTAATGPINLFEQIPVQVFSTRQEGSRFAAAEVAGLIREKQSRGKKCVLGLATGSTPEAFYAELVRLHQEEGLSFKNVITFNLDEYYPIDRNASQSYHTYMQRHLFQHIDIDPANINIPDGQWPIAAIEALVAEYDRKIEAAGGIDLQILGIGNNGHIGFNEPGSGPGSTTRLIKLAPATRQANAREFSHISEVPYMAVTMGIGTILKAKKIILLAWGAAKAEALQKAAEGNITGSVPASFLQQHGNCMFITDPAAASELTRFKFNG